MRKNGDWEHRLNHKNRYPKFNFMGFHHVWIYWFILRVDDLVVLKDSLFSSLLSGFRFRFWVSEFFISLSNCLKPWLNRLFCCSIPWLLIEKWICIQDLSELVKYKEECPYYKWVMLKDEEDVTFSSLSRPHCWTYQNIIN